MPAASSLPESLLATPSDALRLSTAHISREKHQGPALRYAQGGNYASLSFGRRPGRVGGGGLRGEIIEFSAAARRRMLVTLNSIDRSRIEKPFFVTLTWHDCWPEHSADRTRQLDALIKRLEVVFGQFPFIWRVEWKPRLSGAREGEMAPHLHLLVFLPATTVVGGYLPRKQREYAAEMRLRNRVAFAWNEIVAAGDDAHLNVGLRRKSCELVKTWRGANAYAAKYMAKLESFVPGSAGIGRNWGIRRKGLLGIILVRASLTMREAITLRRVFRCFSGQRYRNHLGDLQSASCFLSCSTSLRLLRWLGYYADPPPDPRSAWSGAKPRRGTGGASPADTTLLAVEGG